MSDTDRYSRDPATRVWRRPSHQGIGYSDGDAVECRMLGAIRKSLDVSAASKELRSHITDWPSEYHLSSVRHNLLRPFLFKSTDRIMELGCGCGAITRYLGETGANTISVEGSYRRAEIAAERCRDLPNVTIYCDNLADFRSEEKFDYVTLIGVLEYAPLFIKSDDPIGACLAHALSFLKADGVLILAIENKLGLKYFNGCSEDHTGVPYFGINGLYDAGTPITFGRRELEAQLGDAGFADLTFYYPFPDYKLPNLILAEDAFAQDGFQPADLLYRAFSRDYGGSMDRAFHECLAWQSLARNGLMEELANSFLVFARKAPSAAGAHSSWLARLYSTERLPSFATETVFLQDGGSITVAKRQLFPHMPAPIPANSPYFRHRLPPHVPYISGRLYITELQPIMARGGGMAEVAQWAKPWVAHLTAMTQPGSNHTMMLPGECLDTIPANFVRDGAGALVEIDVEWQPELSVPLTWVLIRGLVNALSVCPCSPALASLTFRDVVSGVLASLGHPLSESDYRVAVSLEDTLHDTVYGECQHGASLAKLLDGPLHSFASPPTYAEEIIALRREIARVKTTVSWQITKPLRVFWNVLRSLLPSDSAKR